MSVELSILMWSGVLLLVLILTSANANLMSMGLSWGLGNRDDAATPPAWGARAKRAYMNLLENLLVFAAILVPVSLSGISNDMTVLGAQIVLGARIVHALVYVTGVTLLGIRTLAYFAGIAGTVIILLQAL